ncbi:hypothetical protein A1OW_12920 [Enterovibrio norvegicus]|uniref:Uncharacterized protein n=2 Tax=Enterovibrio norvegicus TaxID=188144 RepID=A0A1I5KFL4_9GAMM|nr:hypothetical protein [Enterovibrio norvegicus]OEF49313.1 hypothetical protein A1OW_12920 [Enterovibrio norvegicus]OEF55982.1 hypothetical protein A1OU_14475 [Enterovibrio norvegicus]SFO83854.1 hypothetical protein SAMN03084138_00629 [Enterovibrio norvegicus DSM 15893]
MKKYSYSLIWRLRHLTVILVAGAVPFTLSAIKLGISPILEEPWVVIYIWALLSLITIPRIIRERVLTHSLFIDKGKVKNTRSNGVITKFDIKDISKVTIVDASESLNGFKEEEMIVELKSNSEKIIVPVNILGFNDLYEHFTNNR